MILTCPECATSYFVDDSKIGEKGRSVRCASCAHRWTARVSDDRTDALFLQMQHDFPEVHAQPDDGEAPSFGEYESFDDFEDEPAVPAPAPPPRLETRPVRRGSEAATAAIVWSCMLVFMGALAGAAYLFRVPAVDLWPKAASAYAAVGIPVNRIGLEPVDVSFRPALRDGRAALVVTGAIRNVKDHPVASPSLEIALLGHDGKPLAVKYADPDHALIQPGQSRSFSVDVYEPPLAAEHATVRFALNRKASPGGGEVMLRGPVAEAPAMAPPPIEAKPLPPESEHALPHG